MRVFLALLIACATPAAADTLVAKRMIPARAILTAADMAVQGGEVPGTLAHPDEALGMEARVVIYPGRPIMAGDVGAPALIERNEVVTLVYKRGSLLIATEARALGRAAEGDMLRVMNLSSRSTVTGRVDKRGRVLVGPSQDMMTDLEDF